MQLARADIQRVLDFLADVEELDDGDPYSPEVMLRLQSLIPSVAAQYQEVDVGARRFVSFVSSDPADGDSDDELHYWSVGPCPIADYRVRTADLTTVRMSDVVGRARWHDHAVYRDYFRPFDVESFLDLGLGAGRDRYRSVVLMRERDDMDFSDRDVAVLESLRPHLRAREARAALREALLLAPVTIDRADDSGPQLTAREREVIALVAEGKTNAEIAAELWVTPGTVKKHLENVYVKLGVGSRAAAASRVQVSSSAG